MSARKGPGLCWPRRVPTARHVATVVKSSCLSGFKPITPAGDKKVRSFTMCRNIKTLANFEPPATEDEVRASALQFVRKLSGMNSPSHANQEVFDRAVEEVTNAAARLIESLATNAPPRNREEEA